MSTGNPILANNAMKRVCGFKSFANGFARAKPGIDFVQFF